MLTLYFFCVGGHKSKFFQHKKSFQYRKSLDNHAANTRRLPNVDSMLARRLRRRSNIKPTSGRGILFVWQPYTPGFTGFVG